VNSTIALRPSLNLKIVVLRLFEPCTAIQGRVERKRCCDAPPVVPTPEPPALDNPLDDEPAAPELELRLPVAVLPEEPCPPVTAPAEDPWTDGVWAEGVCTEGVCTVGAGGTGAGGDTGGGGTVTEGTVTDGTVTVGTVTVGTGTGSPWASASDAAIPPSAQTTPSMTADLTSE